MPYNRGVTLLHIYFMGMLHGQSARVLWGNVIKALQGTLWRNCRGPSNDGEGCSTRGTSADCIKYVYVCIMCQLYYHIYHKCLSKKSNSTEISVITDIAEEHN